MPYRDTTVWECIQRAEREATEQKATAVSHVEPQHDTEPDQKPKTKKHRRAGWCGQRRIFMTTYDAVEQFPIDCGCWKCPHCVETILRPRLLTDTLRRGAKGYLYYSKHDPAEWTSLKKRLNRLRANFRRFQIRGVLHLLSDHPVPGCSMYFHTHLMALITKLVNGLPYGKRSFSSSRGWSMKTPVEPSKGRTELHTFSKPDMLAGAATVMGLKFARFDDYVRVKVSGPEQAEELLRLANKMSLLPDTSLSNRDIEQQVEE